MSVLLDTEVSIFSIQRFQWLTSLRAQELCESRGGRPDLPVPNSPYGFCGRKATLNLNVSVSEFRTCVKVEVDALGSPSLTIPTVSVVVKQHLKKKT